MAWFGSIFSSRTAHNPARCTTLTGGRVGRCRSGVPSHVRVDDEAVNWRVSEPQRLVCLQLFENLPTPWRARHVLWTGPLHPGQAPAPSATDPLNDIANKVRRLIAHQLAAPPPSSAR